jgi:putative MFS transporter
MKKTTIAEIIDGMGLNKFTWRIVFLIGMANLLAGVANRIPSYTMPQISKEWALTGVQTGMISSYGGFGSYLARLWQA